MEIYIDEITRSPLEELSKEYQYKETIASGSFGTVIRAIQLSDGKEVAIKIIKKSTRHYKASAIKHEIEILKQLSHPNILEFIGYTETNLKLYIIMEYIKDGTLKAWLKQNKDHITEKEARTIIERLILAANYLHSKDICHRDIKLENLMLNDRNDLTSIKLIDFGLSADNFHSLEEHNYCGTYIFMSPEQLDKRSYSKYVDLWSIGVIMFMLLHSGRHPFYTKGDTKESFCQKMKNPQYEVSDTISKEARHLLKSLLDINPNKRIHGEKASNHPWITNNALDPLPINFYQSLIHKSIKKKMQQAILIGIFCNYISNNNSDKRKIPVKGIEKEENEANRDNKDMKLNSLTVEEPLLRKKKISFAKGKRYLKTNKPNNYEPSQTQSNIKTALNSNNPSQKEIKTFETINIQHKGSNHLKIVSNSLPKSKRTFNEKIKLRTKKISGLSPIKLLLPQINKDQPTTETAREGEVIKERDYFNQCQSARSCSMLLQLKQESEKMRESNVIKELNLAKLLKNTDLNIQFPSKRNKILFKPSSTNTKKLNLFHLCLPHINLLSPL